MPARFIMGMLAGAGAVSVAAAVGVVATRAPDTLREPSVALAGRPDASGDAAPGAASAPALAAAPRLHGLAAELQPEADDRSAGFDVVRVEPDGSAVIAGRAAPDAELTLLLDGRPLAETRAGPDGDFVVFAEIPPSDRPRRLELRSGGTEAFASVFIAPSASGAAPTVVSAGEDEVTVVQRAARDAAEPVALDLVSAAEDGAVAAEGRAAPGSHVRVYAGDDLLAEAQADPEGEWRAEATADLPSGATLRVDELAKDGEVRSRLEAPFDAAEAAGERLAPGQIVVEPGQNLWRLAEEVYGRGVRYTVIYEANADRVRDPNLIFPGQVLDVPVASR